MMAQPTSCCHTHPQAELGLQRPPRGRAEAGALPAAMLWLHFPLFSSPEVPVPHPLCGTPELISPPPHPAENILRQRF